MLWVCSFLLLNTLPVQVLVLATLLNHLSLESQPTGSLPEQLGRRGRKEHMVSTRMLTLVNSSPTKPLRESEYKL